MSMPIKNQGGAGAIPDRYPLSPLQQGMLYDTLLDPGSGVDIVQMVVDLHEALDMAALQRAWRCVVDRHAVLRTSFTWEVLDEPRQEVHAEVELPWQEHDWREIAIAERDRCTADFLAADRRRGFDMARAPLFRLTVLRYGESEFQLIASNHHAILDGRSRLLLLREAFSFYEAFRVGHEMSLPLPRPYRDYIDWLQRGNFSKSEAFWRTTLKAFTVSTPLVVDQAPGARRETGVQQGDEEVRLPAPITSALRTLAKDNQLTLNTIVQGAWALLLSRYSGEPDVVFGVVRASRHSTIESAEAMVGLFINTLPLRVRLSSESTLLPWLNELRAQWSAMRAHEQTPLTKLRAWSEAPAGCPLFESIVIFENYDLDTLMRMQGSHWTNRRVRTKIQPNFPLTLAAFDGAELLLRITFDCGRIDDAAAGRMLGHLCVLLEAFAVNPEGKLREFPLLGLAERHQLLVTWNQTQADYPGDRCVDELFEQQALSTPERVAVVHEQRRMSYRELSERSDQVARQLRALGAGPGVLIGLYVERSLEMVVGLLGILKTGGAYIPLDPIYPAERLAYMMEDARPLALLTQKRLLGQVPRGRAEVVCLDVLPAETNHGEVAPPASSQRGSGDLAYVLYTSGSTGQPKGVQIPHRALVNFLSAMRRTPGLTADDRLLSVTTLSFDIAALEIFLPLTSGACLVIAGSNVTGDGARLSSLMKASGATVMQATPATWRLLLDAGWNGDPCLKILCGGESWSAELARELLARCGSLWNMYGPTEATVWSSVYRVKSGEPVLIGPPIANTSFYVLQADRQPAPIGVPGELYIGGHGVALGYLHRPDLTKGRFVDDPFNRGTGSRLYRTGDLVRYRTNGSIEFLGRTDDQVKIRGYRIEPGEIETVIARHSAVRQVVVVAREDLQGNKRLVAYLVTENPPVDLVDQLRALLRASLPTYMIPAHFVGLDALPLTPNGKIDRKSLPNPDASDHALAASDYIAPRTLLELSLATIWEKVLGVQRVGINDNFFELGGDSLGVLTLISELEQATGITIDPGKVFETPTIAGLGAGLGSEAARTTSLVVALQPEGDGIPIFCLLGINQYKHFATSLGQDQPVYGVYVVEEEALVHQAAGGGRSDVSTERLVDAYYQAIARVRPDGPYRLAGLSLGGILAMELASKMRKAGSAVDLVILLDACLPQGRHRNWRKWLSFQAAEVMNGNASRTLRRKLTGILGGLGAQLPSALRSDSANVTQIGASRHAAFLHVIGKWRARDPQFDFHTILFRASDRLARNYYVDYEEDYGWRRFLTGTLTVMDVPGSHLSIVNPPDVVLIGSLSRPYLRPAPDAKAVPGPNNAPADRS